MNQYKTWLFFGISLNLMSGCIPNYDSPSESKVDAPPQRCSSANYFYKTHLKSATSALSTVSPELISKTLCEQKSLIKYVMSQCEQNGVPVDVAFMPILASNYNPASNNDGNVGLWQINPVMAQNLSLTNDYWFDARKDVVASTEAVISYLKFLHFKLESDWTLAFAAYHTGLQPILDAVNYNKAQGMETTFDKLNLDPEVSQYIKSLQAVIHSAQHIDILSSDNLETVSLPGQIELEKLAEIADVNLTRLEFLNSGFKRPLTDPDGPHRVLVDAKDFNAVMNITRDVNKLRRISKSNWSHHITKKNENLSLIAHRFETSVSEIKRVNHLQSNVIQVNQKLIIPDATPQAKTQIESNLNKHPGPKRILHPVSTKDTLYQLSTKYRVSISEISHWNNLKDNAIFPEQVLTIWQYSPTDTARFYTVKPDDSLAKIARAHKISISGLKQANQLDGDIIHPNDRLLIPSKTG